MEWDVFFCQTSSSTPKATKPTLTIKHAEVRRRWIWSILQQDGKKIISSLRGVGDGSKKKKKPLLPAKAKGLIAPPHKLNPRVTRGGTGNSTYPGSPAQISPFLFTFLFTPLLHPWPGSSLFAVYPRLHSFSLPSLGVLLQLTKVETRLFTGSVSLESHHCFDRYVR